MIGLGINLALGVIKLTVGLAQESFALVADAINSLGDGLTSAVVIIALRISQRPPDEEHPYGHSRAETIAASNVAVVVIIGAIMVAFEAVRRVHSVHSSPSAIVLIIAGTNVLIKEGLYRYKSAVARRVRSQAIMAVAWDHRADAFCALAVLFGALAIRMGSPSWADEVAALVVVGAILFAGISLFRTAGGELLDPQATPEQIEAVREIALAVPDVMGLDKLITRKAGLVFFVDIHVEVHPDTPVSEGHRIGHDVKDAIMDSIPEVADVLVHLEPYRPERH